MPHEEEFKLGNYTIKFFPYNIMPANSNQKRTNWIKIEVYQKGIIRSKLIQSRKYQPSPALTIRGFLSTLAKQNGKSH